MSQKEKLPVVYRGSVKDIQGPVIVQGGRGNPIPSLVFRYSDAYSIFDWGRMPDELAGKGQALAVIAADLFEKISRPQIWKEFLKTQEAIALRRGVSKIKNKGTLAAEFNDWGDRLSQEGLRTHYLGVVDEKELGSVGDLLTTTDLGGMLEPVRHLAVRRVNVLPPEYKRVLGRTVRDYSQTQRAKLPRLVPLEVIFRFSCPPGSSLLKRLKQNPDYLDQLAIPLESERKPFNSETEEEIWKTLEGVAWEFPVIELSTKLEESDRMVSFQEALSISGLRAEQMNQMLLQTAWVAGYLKNYFGRVGLDLADGKLEWALSEQGEVFLVDAIGPDEVRLLKDGVQISKEVLRQHYRNSEWVSDIERAKAQAQRMGVADWKKLVGKKPLPLPPSKKRLATQLYQSLANELTGRKWFAEAWPLEQVAEGLKEIQNGSGSQPGLKSEGKKVLVIGSGGREHALAWKLKQSPRIAQLIVAPGNDAIQADDRWDFESTPQGFERLADRAKLEGIDLVVVGPDNPLADGIVDVLESRGVLAFGPRAQAARIEASKSFSKEIMKAAGVPTARYKVALSKEEAVEFLKSQPWPPERGASGWVVKADGLAFGKGVIVCTEQENALAAVDQLFPLSGKLVIEERLIGEEISWMAICDGKNAALLEPARDYKPLKDGNAGPNTGGMGSFSPVPEVMGAAFSRRVRKEIFDPILKEMNQRGFPFKGLLYAGLMFDAESGSLWVIEFNARFGDPETQVLLPRIEGDLYPWLEASAKGDLSELPPHVPFIQDAAVFVVAAAPGYPDAPQKGLEIKGPLYEMSLEDPEMSYFAAGVKRTGSGFVTNGGRVLGALGKGPTLSQAAEVAYEKLEKIRFHEMHYRLDIGGGGQKKVAASSQSSPDSPYPQEES